MNIRKRIGILLILIGVALPVVLYFFQEDGLVFTINIHRTIERKLSKEEIAALSDVSELKKKLQELLTFTPDLSWFKPPKDSKNQEWKLETPIGNISFEGYKAWVAEYEDKYVSAIKKSYAINNFDKEGWVDDSIKRIEISFRKMVGVGALLVFLGFGFLIFSFFHKRKNT